MRALLLRGPSRIQLDRSQSLRLDNWREWLTDRDAVVGYCPDRDPGFVYVLADERHDRPGGLPIRPRMPTTEEFHA